MLKIFISSIFFIAFVVSAQAQCPGRLNGEAQRAAAKRTISADANFRLIDCPDGGQRVVHFQNGEQSDVIFGPSGEVSIVRPGGKRDGSNKKASSNGQ